MKPDSIDEGGRVVVYLGKGHPLARPDGWQLRARWVAMQLLDRQLEPEEEVRHVNGEAWDDRPANLVVIQGPSGRGEPLTDLACWNASGRRLVAYEGSWACWAPRCEVADAELQMAGGARW